MLKSLKKTDVFQPRLGTITSFAQSWAYLQIKSGSRDLNIIYFNRGNPLDLVPLGVFSSSNSDCYTMTSSRRAIHFGAGNIGRGFIGPLLVQSGYHVVFADIDKKIIDNINQHGEYLVHILDPSKPRPVAVSDISGVISTSDDILTAIADPRVNIITTSVGVGVLPRIARTFARGISERRKAASGPMNIIACENAVGATATLAKSVDEYFSEEDREYAKENVGFANCAVDRIVPPFKNDTPLDVGVEGFSGAFCRALSFSLLGLTTSLRVDCGKAASEESGAVRHAPD